MQRVPCTPERAEGESCSQALDLKLFKVKGIVSQEGKSMCKTVQLILPGAGGGGVSPGRADFLALLVFVCVVI